MSILVTGGSGLIGKNLQMQLPNAVYISSKEFDLTNDVEVDAMFQKYKPSQVIHLASKVGGVFANRSDQVGFFENNILINTNVLKYAFKYKVERLIGMLSTCIFPDSVEYPLTPDKIHLGPPHNSNFGYAYSKRMLEIQIKAYQQQYGLKWNAIIPTNVYGKYDQFNLETAHVIPALIHKCYLAKKNHKDLLVMGTGNVYREFIYVEDLVKIITWALDNYKDVTPLIASTSKQYSIDFIVKLIAEFMGFKGNIIFEGVESNNGQLRKPSDTQPLRNLFTSFTDTPIDVGLKETIKWFMENYELNFIRL